MLQDDSYCCPIVLIKAILPNSSLYSAFMIIPISISIPNTQANKSLEEIKQEKEKVSLEQEDLLARHNLMDTENKKLQSTITKLQAQLKERGTRRKVRVDECELMSPGNGG